MWVEHFLFMTPKKANIGLLEVVVVPSVMYGCETGTLQVRYKQRVEAAEIKC